MRTFPLTSSLTSSLTYGLHGPGDAEWTPAELFRNGEQGGWWDFWDTTVLRRDRAGTTDVTAAGQTVGQIVDKSGRGNHLTANSDAARGLYGIEPLGGRRNLFTYTEDFSNAAWTKTGITQAKLVGSDDTHRITVDTSTGQHCLLNTVIGPVANVQNTLSVRLKYDGSARYISLDWSNSASHYAFFDILDGVFIAGVAGSSIVAEGDGWYRCSLIHTPTNTGAAYRILINNGSDWTTNRSYTGDGVASILVKQPQLEANSSATTYQKVVTALEVTEAGKPSLSYILFDGSDDGYISSTITPGTDKVQVFAGVRKLSDAAIGALAEFSADLNANNGTFYTLAPRLNSTATYGFGSKGTLAAVAVNGVSFAAPITTVVTGLGDIAGDSSVLRLNGAQVSSITTDQGTGNYLAYPLYVGRRGAASLPFNGRLYSLIVRFGPNLPTSTIEQAERWIAARTGVTL